MTKQQKEEQQKLALLEASIYRMLALNTLYAFELKYGKIHLN